MANAIATLVSGGKHCEAHLLKAVKTHGSAALIAAGNTRPNNAINISASALDAVKKGMRNLTTGSLAPYFKDCVVDAGAKTGTAQVSAESENNGVFVCFAPYDEPEIALAIVIEKGGSGAALASSAVKMINAYFSTQDVEGSITGELQLLP